MAEQVTTKDIADQARAAADVVVGAGLVTSVRARWSRKVAADIVGIGDMLIIILTLAIPSMVMPELVEHLPGHLEILRSGLFAGLIAYACFNHWQLYDTRNMSAFPVRADRIVLSIVIAVMAVIGMSAPVGSSTTDVVLIWPVVWLCSACGLLIGYRFIVRNVLASLAGAHFFDERVAVYGAGQVADRVEAYLREAGDGMKFVGAFDDRIDKERLDEMDNATIAGRLGDLIQAGRDGRVDRIIVALPQAADQRLAEISRELEQLPVTVHSVTHFSNDLIAGGHASHKVSNLGPVGLINVKERPLADWAPIVKRGEDILISMTALLLALPVLVIIAAIIKATSRGPILFRQRRRGLNQKVIEVLKFRSMTVQENGDDVRQATRNDQRVTAVGWVLRRSSLDELPQLFNVLVGEMSLVGPRPHALIHDEQWGEMLEQYANRHQVKPGITGLAQVRGLRGEALTSKDIQDRISADLEYIGNWSLWLDISIMARTVRAVVGAKNAH